MSVVPLFSVGSLLDVVVNRFPEHRVHTTVFPGEPFFKGDLRQIGDLIFIEVETSSEE